MARSQKNLAMALIFPFFFLLSGDGQAGSVPPFEVLSLRVEKNPDVCQSTLYVTIRNNTQSPSDSALFVHAAQFQELQKEGQQWSSHIGALRLNTIPAGESREVSYSFIRERVKNGVSFRFKIGAETIAYFEKSLPPVLDQYSGKMENLVYDQASNVLTGSVVNKGNVAIPTPSIGVSLASPEAPDDFKAGGGGQIAKCLAPGASMTFTRQMLPAAAESVIKVNFSADGIVVLDTQFRGKPPAMKSKTTTKQAPKMNTDVKTKRDTKTIRP